MNTIQLGSITTQIDISKYVKETVEAQPEQQVEVEAQISNDIPARGTKQYDELKAALTNAKVPVTDENIKTANLMIKSGIEVQKENIEAAADIKGQLEYIINHANEDCVKSIMDNKISLDKITMDILENVIREVNKTEMSSKTSASKEEVKKETDKYVKKNDLKDKEEIDNVSKCIENLLQQGLPVTDKNIQALESVISKSEEIKSADKDIVLNLLKKGKDTTIENIYVSKFSSNKKYSSNKKVDDKTWKELLPQVEKLVDSPKFENKQKAIDAAKLLLENEIPITEENISEITDIEKLQSDGIDTDKLLEEATKNLKADRPVSDVELNKVIKDTSSNENVVSNKSSKQVSKTKPNDKTDKATPQRDIVEYDIKKQQYEQIVKEIQQYGDDVINRVLDSGGDLTLKNLHMALEQLKQQDKTEETLKEHNRVENSQLTSEQKKELKENIEKELKTVTAKRQLAEIQLRLTSEAMSTLMQKGIDIDTMSLKDVVNQLKSIEKDLYKTHLEIAGAEANDENIGAMKDLYDKLSNITDLSAPTYQQVVHKDIPFTITDLSDAEELNTNSQLLQLQQASDTYENLQTQPNPKFKESFSKVAEQIEPLLNDLGIEATEENIRAAKILVKNKMEVNEENILDIKLIDTKVSEVTTQLHPTIAANMIRDGLKPAQMHIDDVIKYMNKFEDLLGEDLSEKISSYIYEMDKAGELTQPERETMIGIYRMLYTIDKTQGRATGFVVKNDMDLTLNNLMEAANYYDRTNARYTDIDVKIDDKFGAIDKVIANEKSIKAQLNKAYENNTNENKRTDEFTKELTSLTQVDLNDKNTSIKTVAKNISLNDAIKLVKSNDNVLNEAIKQLPKFIKRNSTLIQNSDISNQPLADKPLANLDIDHVIEATNNIKTLTAKNKEDIVKIYNTLRNIQTSDDEKLDVNKTLNDVNKELENIKNDVEENIKINLNPAPKIFASKSSEIKDIINDISINDIVKLSNNKNIEDISIAEIKNSANKNIENKVPIVDMSQSELLKQINSLPDKTKELIMDIKRATTTINSIDTKTLDELNKNIQSFNLNDLIKETKNIETLKSVDKLIQNFDMNSINTLKSSDILNMDIDSVLETIKENKQQNTKSLIEYSTDEILNYINRDDVGQEQKDTVLKLYNTFNTIQNSDNKALKEVDTDSELNINKLLDLVGKFKVSKQTEETSNTTTKNEITHLLQKLTFEDIKNIIKKESDISNVDLNKLEQATKQTKQKPIAQTDTTELINYIKSDNTSSDNIIKMYDLINTVSTFDEENMVNLENIKTVGDLEAEVNAFKQSKQEAKLYQQKENDLNEFMQKIDVDKIASLIKENSDLEDIPIAKIVEDIEKIPTSKQSNLVKMDKNEIINYINKSDLNASQKELAIKISDTLKNIADKTDMELPAKEELTINTLIEADKVEQNKEAIKKLVQNIDLNKLTSLIKKESDLENISIAKIVENIEKTATSKQTDLVKMDKNGIVNYINKSDLNASQKELAIKISDTLKNIADKTDIELPANEELTISTLIEADKVEQNKEAIKKLVQNIDLSKLTSLIKKESDLENISIAKIVENIEKMPTSKQTDLVKMDKNEIINYINKSDLNASQKELAIKISDTLKNIADKTDMELPANEELTISTLIEADKVEQNKEAIKKLVQNIDLNKLTSLIKKESDLEKISIAKIVEDIEKMPTSKQTDLVKMDKNEVINYINESDLSTPQKELAIKIADTLKNIADKSDIEISPIDKEELTINILEAINKIEQIKHTITEFVKQTDLNKLSTLIRKHSNIETVPIAQLTKEIEAQQTDIKNNLENIDMTKVFEHINKSKTFNQQQKDTILKVFNTVNDLINIDMKSVETIEKSSNEINLVDLKQSVNSYMEQEDLKFTDAQNKNILNNFINSITADRLVKLVKNHSSLTKVAVKDIVENESTSNKVDADISLDIDKLKDYIKSANLTPRQKETFANVADAISKIKSSEKDIQIFNSDFTIDDLVNQIQQKKDIKDNSSTDDRIREENIKNTLNEFIQKADSQTVSKLVEQYPELENLSIDKIVDYMNNIKDSKLNFIGNNITNRVVKNILQDKFTVSNEVEKIINTVEAVKSLDIHTVVDKVSKEVKDITLDKLINIVEDMNEISKPTETPLNNLSATNETPQIEKLNGYETKQDEYNKTLLTKFIQSAQPEIMSKVIKQYSAIENIPIENLLKSMELVQADKSINTKDVNTGDNSNKVKEFLESLNKISKAEPATMLWMQKQNIPLTINNIEVVQNFIKNPFWLGEQLNKFSKNLKDKLGEQKDISKAVSKKSLSALKDGKTATNLLEDLEEEIAKTKKDIIKLPEQERQNLWKQSSNLEKAIELQKQIQKDEMIYQIPMQLHNGLTNMNLYVMNDREGNGKSVNDEMKVFLAMNTETLGTVQIYMRMSEKSVSFQINSDNPEATKFLQSQQVALQSSIENLGYMVNKMQYGQEQRKSPLQSQIQSQIKPSGKNISEDGFEAII